MYVYMDANIASDFVLRRLRIRIARHKPSSHYIYVYMSCSLLCILLYRVIFQMFFYYTIPTKYFDTTNWFHIKSLSCVIIYLYLPEFY